MKKSLIALTLAALPVAAMADVTLYGQIKAGVEVNRVKVGSGNQAVKSHTETKIADFGSRIGFKGHEHIGNNLNAIWQVENKVSVAGGGSWASRDSFIGLEGDFGKVRAGKLSTQLKDMGAVDPWEYNSANLGLAAFTRTGTREVSVRYDSPVFSGFSGNVQFTPRDNANADRSQPTKAQYFAGLNYENAGFFAQYGFGLKKNNYVKDSKGKDGYVHRVEAGYDANNLFVAAGFQATKGWDTAASYSAALTGAEVKDIEEALADANLPNVALKTQEVAVTGAYRLGNVTPRVSYAHGWDVKDATNGNKGKGTKYDQVVVGADYDFSKRTTAMVSAGWLKVGKGDNKVQQTGGLVGLRHKF